MSRELDVCVAKKLGYAPFYQKLIDQWWLDGKYKNKHGCIVGYKELPNYSSDHNSCFKYVVPEIITIVEKPLVVSDFSIEWKATKGKFWVRVNGTVIGESKLLPEAICKTYLRMEG